MSMTFREELNGGQAGADNRITDIMRLSQYGDMLHGVRGKAVTQTAGTEADMIDLDVIGGAGVKIPPCYAGACVQSRAGGTSAVGNWRVGGVMTVEVPAAGLTIAGADADGGVVITPRAGFTLRYAQYTPDVNEANVRARRITTIDENLESVGDSHPVKEVFVRIKTTDGTTIDATETATDIVAALNADTNFTKWAVASVTGTGASLVASQGVTVRGVLPIISGFVAAMSYYGHRIIFPTTVTNAVLNWGPAAPTWDLNASGRYAPQVR